MARRLHQRGARSLHAEGFDHDASEFDWGGQLAGHSLGWVCAREGSELVGFINVGWDGNSHAFVLDTVVDPSYQGRGIGTELVATAVREAKAAGCEWLHVDFEEVLRHFYLDSCGFRTTSAGLLNLREA